ncbi:hypothetical protein PUN28_006212 [Cardiocondyla obscurior]|uniref:Uncharacterized protein n=1 Tax=Cardiocondyla obscurior TaxID=286306 RepID=A0AAW2GA42_9HYME
MLFRCRATNSIKSIAYIDICIYLAGFVKRRHLPQSLKYRVSNEPGNRHSVRVVYPCFEYDLGIYEIV